MRVGKILLMAPLAVAAFFFLSCAAGGSVCGDGTCSSDETVSSCPRDCFCGNGTCDVGEYLATCPQDCAASTCGDGLCDAGESMSSCPQDCYCGNGTCDFGESVASCPQDCAGSTCGDGVCSSSESVASCPQDCYCGNATCDIGESPTSCPLDCTGSAYCGDGTCDVGENPTNCPADCGTCGNGTCDAGENPTNCPQDCSGCIHATCDLWPQCGCNTTMKCSILSDQRQCLAAGSSAHGSTCTSDESCAAGTICVGSSAADLRCLQFCNDNADCPGAGGVCVYQMNDTNQNPIPGAKLCTKDCNPVTPGSTCPSGWTCELYYIDENQDEVPDYWLTDCSAEAGTAGTGAYCDGTTTLCAPGNWCYINATDPDNTNQCIKNCRVGVAGDCPGTTCYDYDIPIVIGGVSYGYCF